MKFRLLAVIGSLIVSLILGEIGARVVLSRSVSSGFRDKDFYESRRQLTQWEGGNWLRQVEPHPYFGFVMNHDGTAANNFGFNDTEPFPYVKKSKKEFVIGVLGGSVALGWGGWAQGVGRKDFEDLLRKRLPALADRHVVLLNMALGGYKQPQQLYVASYFMESVDLFVNIDGHNELRALSNQGVFPIEYPIGTFLFFWNGLQVMKTNYALRFFGKLSSMLIEGGASHPLLGRSALYYSLANGVFLWTKNRSKVVSDKAREAYSAELQHPSRDFYTKETRTRDAAAAAVEIWERFSLQEQRLLDVYGKKVIFFLQPNQYLPGSKRLSEWESRNAIDSNYVKNAREYQLLPPAAKRLKAKRVNMHDLTMIFEKESDTVYADACCHLNEKGNRIMAEAILARIAQTLKLP